MSITAKELAKELNLSAAAVSLALNNKPGVSTETRNRVWEAAKRGGYDFGHIRDKNAATRSIAYIIFQKHGIITGDTVFFNQVAEGISIACREMNCKLRISICYADANSIRRQIEDLRLWDVSGIIFAGPEASPVEIRQFLELKIPFTLLDAYYDELPCDSVLINNTRGALLATRYLIRQCRTQPGYLASSYKISNFNERADGFYQAIREAGMSPSRCIVHRLTPSLEGAMADMTEILNQGELLASCYFADNDFIATGAIQAFKARGLRIPEDISVVGFDDIPIARMPDFSLTTVAVPKQYLGRVAVESVLRRISKPLIPSAKLEISADLVVRKSVRKEH